MTRTDPHGTTTEDRDPPDGLADASWFQVAAATARAHHDVERCVAGAERRAAQERYDALRRLLDSRTDDLASHPVYGGAHRSH